MKKRVLACILAAALVMLQACGSKDTGKENGTQLYLPTSQLIHTNIRLLWA